MSQQQQYAKYEGGIYEGVTHIEFFTKDRATGRPIFKAKDRGGQPSLVSYYRIFMGDKEGPPGSVSPGDVSLLVHAFGGDPARLPAQDDPTFLAVAEQLIGESDTLVTLYAHKGPSSDSAWVRTVYGAELPADHAYLFMFDGVTSRKDGQPIWYDGEWGQYARLNLKVWANGDGSPTHFAGATQTLYVNRPAMTILRALLGSTMTALLGPVDGELRMLEEMATSQNGTRLIYANIIMKANGKGTTVDKTTLQAIDAKGPFPAAIYAPVAAPQPVPSQPAPPVAPAAPVPTPTSPTVTVKPQSAAMTALRAVIAGGTRESLGADAFDGAGNITTHGKSWCATHLKPISQAKRLTNKFAEMTDDTCIAYVLGLNRRDKLVELGVLPADEAETGDWQ